MQALLEALVERWLEVVMEATLHSSANLKGRLSWLAVVPWEAVAYLKISQVVQGQCHLSRPVVTLAEMEVERQMSCGLRPNRQGIGP